MAGPRRNSAARKLSDLLWLSVATTISLMLASVAALVLQHARIATLNRDIQPTLFANRQLQLAVTQAHSALRGYVYGARPDYRQQFSAAQPVLADRLNTLDLLSTNAHVSSQLAEQRAAVTSWATAAQAALRPGADITEVEERFDRFQTVSGLITQELLSESGKLRQQSETLTWAVISGLVAVAGCEAVFLAYRGLRIRSQIGPPLARLQAVAAARRSGQLAVRADTGVGVEEIRVVAAELNDLLDAEQERQDTLATELQLAQAISEIGLRIGDHLDLQHITDQSARALQTQFRAKNAWVRIFEPTDALSGTGARGAHPPIPLGRPTEQLVVQTTRTARQAWADQTALVVRRDPVPARVGPIGIGEHPIPDDPATDQSDDQRSSRPGRACSVDQRDAASCADDRQEAGQQLDGGRTGSDDTASGFRSRLLDYVEAAHTHSMLVAAIGSGQHCLGAIALGSGDRMRQWSTAEINALTLAGKEIGQAVARAHLYHREQSLLRQAQELEALRSDFVATVSHELRTPLTSILGNIELIRQGDIGTVDTPIDTRLAVVERNGHRLRLLIEDLLTLSKIEQRSSHFRPVSVEDMITDCLLVQSDLAATRDIAIRTDLPGHVRSATVLGSVAELGRVLTNVIGNAIKYSPPGSEVTLAGAVETDGIRIDVRDRGIGISTADQARLFDRFFRSADPDARSVNGTGLGLAISKEIVERHNGTITVSSSKGEGTTMTLRLPTVDSRSWATLDETEDHHDV